MKKRKMEKKSLQRGHFQLGEYGSEAGVSSEREE
jgi:hypothetical protein